MPTLSSQSYFTYNLSKLTENLKQIEFKIGPKNLRLALFETKKFFSFVTLYGFQLFA